AASTTIPAALRWLAIRRDPGRMTRPQANKRMDSSGEGANPMFGRPARPGPRKLSGRRISAVLYFAAFLPAASDTLADQLMPLTVESTSRQTIVLTQGFSTTIRSERAFAKISITNPDIVD